MPDKSPAETLAYAQGWHDALESQKLRSNIIPEDDLTCAFPSLEEALKSFTGEVTKLPPAGKLPPKPEMTLADIGPLGEALTLNLPKE